MIHVLLGYLNRTSRYWNRCSQLVEFLVTVSNSCESERMRNTDPCIKVGTADSLGVSTTVIPRA